MTQRKDEWINNTDEQYYDRQFHTPYRSTEVFCDWLINNGLLDSSIKSSILDIGTGKGANLNYMQKRFPNCNFLGIDINLKFIHEGNDFFYNNKIPNCSLEYGDIFNLSKTKYKNQFDGIVSLQTLSWIPNYEKALTQMIALNPKWIAISSLFYEGLINCKIEISEYENEHDNVPTKESLYNIYSLPKVKHLFASYGFTTFKFIPFVIDIDLPLPNNPSKMGSHTIKLENQQRLQISGPILMNWYFILACR